MNSIEETELLFLLLLIFVIGFGSLARAIKMPYPIVLVIAGLLLSFIPGLPRFHLDPNLIFLAVLPPLLFSAALNTSWRDFRYHFVTIISMASLLVAFTVAGVAGIAHFLLPGFDWRLGLVLGSVIAPTDAIAATAIAKRLHLPQRIIDLLEGESLVNDASGLLALEFTTAWIVTGQTPTLQEGLLRLCLLAGGGIAIGFAVGWLVYFFERKVDDPPIEITLSLVVPYISYISAETLHCSGVLAAVTAGLYLGTHRSTYTSSAVRVESRGFWNTFTFVLNGLVFLLIGLQLPNVLAGIRGISTYQLVVDTAQLVLAVILLRLIWIFPGSYTAYLIRKHILGQPEAPPSFGAMFVVGWTGMRGVISLAAAIALPEALANGSPFPQRSAIIYLTFAVIFATTVFQGLMLPFIIRKLGLARSPGRSSADVQARTNILRATIKEIQKRRDRDDERYVALYDELLAIYKRRLSRLMNDDDDATEEEGQPMRDYFGHLSRELRNFERSHAAQLRSREQINDEVFRALEHELDLLDLRSAEP